MKITEKSKREPVSFKVEESGDCRAKLVNMFIGLQPMSPALARLTIKHQVTGENLEPVYTVHTTNIKGTECKLGKDLFRSPRNKSSTRNLQLIGKDSLSSCLKYNDDCTAAYNVINERAMKSSMVLTAATVTLSDEVCIAAREHVRGAVACINERLVGDKRRRSKGWRQVALVAIEESKNALMVDDGVNEPQKRLHAHILTCTGLEDGSRIEDLQRCLKRLAREGVKNGVEVKTSYIAKFPYSDAVRLDEEINGELPASEEESLVDPLGRGAWKETRSGEQYVFRRLPVNQRWADYLCKDIDAPTFPANKSKPYGMINGLKSEVAAYKRERYEEGIAFKRINFVVLDKAVSILNKRKEGLTASKVLEIYDSLVG